MKMPLTKAFKKEIASLADSKGRRKSGAFIVEGTKCVLDTLDAFNLRHLIATPAWADGHAKENDFDGKLILANRGEIGEMSSMTLAPDVIAVYDLPQEIPFEPQELQNQLVLALDRIQDPGNLGTIMRCADWMGVSTILASDDTVDCFNPKAIQATMGAIARVHIIYGDLAGMIKKFEGTVPVYGTFLEGENIYAASLSSNGIIVMGNEGKGISDKVAALVTKKLLIPSYPPSRPTSESLNVAMASSIVLSQFRSRLMK